MSPSNYKPTFLDIWPQVVASQISLSISIQCGICLSFSGVLIPQLSNDPYMKTSFGVVEASWIASLYLISQPIGSILAGPLMDRYGRRKVCIFQNLPMLLCWVITFFTVDSIMAIYVARLLAGIGAGLSLAGLVYTAEISHVTYRATLLNTNSLHASFGILISTISGVFMDWHECALFFGTLALISFIVSFFLPESPYWMATFSDANQQQVRSVVKKLNRHPEVKAVEWRRIQKTLTRRRLLMGPDPSSARSSWEAFRMAFYSFKERSSYLPFTLLLVLFLLQQASGTYVVIFYTVNIFRSIGGDFDSFFNEYSATISVGVMKFTLCLVTTLVSKVIGRRPILMTSTSGMAVAAFMSAMLLYASDMNTLNFSTLNSTNNVTASIPPVSETWIILSILLYVSTAAIGMMVIPWSSIGELLPIKTRAFASGLMMSYGTALMFIVIKTFPFLVQLLTLPTMFWIYSAVSALSTILIYFYFPETHEKTFSEIENHFDSSSK